MLRFSNNKAGCLNHLYLDKRFSCKFKIDSNIKLRVGRLFRWKGWKETTVFTVLRL